MARGAAQALGQEKRQQQTSAARCTLRRMNQHDQPSVSALRVFVYEELIDRGRMPTSEDIAAHFAVSSQQARQVMKGAQLGKTLLPHPTTGELLMAGPFGAAPTPYCVTTGTRHWWANCAWDALGIAAIVGEAVDIDARCTDCGYPMPMSVSPTDRTLGDGVVHFLLPARRWYEDLGFT
jgi:hypothetical protein